MKAYDFPHINKDSFNRSVQIFLRHPRYSVADRSILKIIEIMPTNTDLSEVVTKVSIIKTLYATPIYDVFRLAEHIMSTRNMDSLIAHGALEAVSRIRTGHGIRLKKTSKEIDFYSFTTKHCSFHNPKNYPIYDNLVADFLFRMNATHSWLAGLKKYELSEYSTYKQLIEKYADFLHLDLNNYKTLDKGLWIIAKYTWLRSRNTYTENDKWLVEEMR